MSLWFRVYTDALNNVKVQSLPDALFKFWFNLLCIAKENDGVLPPVDDISFRLRCSRSRTESNLQSLVSRGLIDETEGGIQPHDWDGHQYDSDSSTKRVQRFRKRRTKQEGNVAETVQRREEKIQIREETDTHAEHPENVRAFRLPPKNLNPETTEPPAAASPKWEEFRERYPLKVELDDAARQFLSLVTLENEAAVFACLDRYLASDQVQRGVLVKPAKWLYQCSRDGWKSDWPKARDSPADHTENRLSAEAEGFYKRHPERRPTA